MNAEGSERVKKLSAKEQEPDLFEQVESEENKVGKVEVIREEKREKEGKENNAEKAQAGSEVESVEKSEAEKHAESVLKKLHSFKPGKGKKKSRKLEKAGKEFTEVEDEDTEIVKPKKEWKQAEIPVSESQEKIDSKDTEIVRPKNPKPFTVPIHGELSKTSRETDVYTPIKKPEDSLEKEFGIREEDLVSEALEEELEREEEFEEIQERENIRKEVLKKAVSESVKLKASSVPLQFLEQGESVFIGRKKSVFQNYGFEGGLLIGRVAEEEHNGKKVFLDSLNPHVIFICGSRGSGKSYIMGVIAEELALKNNNVGVIVIDPVGVFWSMKFPNREQKEVEAMPSWNLMPQGLENLKVFIPEGLSSQTPKNTFDSAFSMRPSLLSSEDWCLTFGIERFSPTGLLLEKALRKVEKGFAVWENEQKTKLKRIEGKEKNYGLDDIINVLENDAELNSRDKGYKQDSIRALVSRFEAAKVWGVFSKKGTPLAELSREGQLTVIDTSFLDDSVTALVIGILARRLLAARKLATRKEASRKFKKDIDEMLELEVPPTWLFIDEAHTLIPSGNVKTPASSGLIEYVKQGRRPGLSLVFATQQPSAIDTKVLSQLDVILSHKLVFDDDIKAIYKRTPTIIPMRYKRPTFVKTLPVGVALTGDRAEETSRAFIMQVRPRMSQHEGRDASTMEGSVELSAKQILELAVGMAKANLEKEGMLDLEKIQALVHTLNTKYKGNSKLDDVLKALEKQGLVIDRKAGTIKTKDFKETIGELGKPVEEKPLSIAEHVQEAVDSRETLIIGETELIALPLRISENLGRKLANKKRQKKFLGIIGSEESIKEFGLKYRTVWKIVFHEFNPKNEFKANECFIDSVSGEFLHYSSKGFVESKGLKELFKLNDSELAVLMEVLQEKKVKEESEGKFKKNAKSLLEKGILNAEKKSGVTRYLLDKSKFDLPSKPSLELLASLNKMSFVKAEALAKERGQYSKEQVIQLLQKMWPNVIVKKVEEVNRPLYEAVLQKADGSEKVLKIDAITGKEL